LQLGGSEFGVHGISFLLRITAKKEPLSNDKFPAIM
jgi:hypothetical protein